jgi:uroporphyrin-III C-methyltransferase/precorrin-2 dehydrogenase/sirohydrochlorin ferrochelatase
MDTSSQPPYLLGLRLGGRQVTVIGGGAVAARRVPALLEAGARVRVVSPRLGASLQDLAGSGRIEWERRGYAAGDCAGAWLVCACADDRLVNAAVAEESERARIWCVRADDAAASSAWTPAAGQAGEVRVGVLSGDQGRGTKRPAIGNSRCAPRPRPAPRGGTRRRRAR